jgi:2'-5' RNA ligase
MSARRAVVVFPDGNGLHVIESLRRRFDPLADVIAAHATLVFPFAAEFSAVELRAHIEHALEGQHSFRARFEGVAEVEDEYLFLDAVIGSEKLVDLHDRLYQGFLAAHRSAAHVYRPHVTIGRTRDPAERGRALIAARELSPVIDCLIRSVSVFRLDDEGGEVIDEVRIR